MHFPYDWDFDYHDYRVILMVEPDDADVLLDGKFIGAAYEFASRKSALRLHSRDHELVIKKQGYTEELIDLRDYSSYDITLRVKLLEEKRRYYASTKKEKKEEEKAEHKYVPKTEPVKEPPVKPEAEPPVKKATSVVNVTLEILPKESAIYLNGKFWGISPESGKIENLRLETGKYTLEVIKPGYRSVKKELEVEDKDLQLSIKLQKK
jgi:hypothetical protein